MISHIKFHINKSTLIEFHRILAPLLEENDEMAKL